jgi:hydroxymethylpyrimidine/phosphomethylpyrimidine kinase
MEAIMAWGDTGQTMTTPHGITRVLSVAGSDSGGGAGIQADLKAFARCGVHGMSAVTVVTAQNTHGVTLVHAVPPEVIVAQIEAVAADIGVDAVKVGMLGSREAVIAVAGALGRLPGVPIVVDPVLVASTGSRLLPLDALDAFGELVLPLATVLTPNLPEARTLVDHLTAAGQPTAAARPVGHARDAPAGEKTDERETGTHGARRAVRSRRSDHPETDADLARALVCLGAGHVVLTGGHREVTSDLYWDGETLVEIPGTHHPGGATHGSGCTHSAILAAQLGLGRSVLDAAVIARRLSGEAVASGLAGLGAGEGPVDVLGLTGTTDPGRRERLP